MRMFDWLWDWRPWMLALLIQITSLHNYFIASSIHQPGVTVLVVGMILVAAFYTYFHNAEIHKLSDRFLNSRLLAASLIFVIWLIGFIIYPIKEGLNQHGTGDDAMQQPILAMMRGEWLYDVQLFDTAPISPGLGWLLLNAPFTVLKVNSLFNPFYLGLMSLAYIHFRRHRDTTNIVLLSIMACFACVEQFYSYQDLLAIGCAFMFVFLLGEYTGSNLPTALGIGVLSGVIATSRVVFLFVPVLLALLWYKRFRNQAVLVGVSGTVVALAIHLIGYLQSDFYQPLHLFYRGFRIQPLWIGAGLAATSLAVLLMLRLPMESFESRSAWFAAMLLIPLFFISIGELVAVDFNLRYWEGAHYLLPAVPAALYAILATRQIPTALP